MQHEIYFPTVSQIRHVRRLVACGLFGPATVARWTGVPLRDVFRIEKAFRTNYGEN